MASQPDRAAGDDRLDHAAKCVAGRTGRVDRRDNRLIGLRVQGVNGARVANRRFERNRRRGDSAELAHKAENGDRKRLQKQPGESTRRYAKCRLASACSLEHLANACLIVDGPRKIDVAAPRRGRFGEPFELRVIVEQPQRERASGRYAMIDA